MAPTRLKKKISNTRSSSTCSATGTSASSYDGDSESRGSSLRSSRLDSFLTTLTPRTCTPRSCLSQRSNSARSSRSASVRRQFSKKVPRKSSLKNSLKSPKNTPKKGSLKVLKKKPNFLPIGKFQMVKDVEVKEQIRTFLSDYSRDPELEAFTIDVDGVPFAAVSLMNADKVLRDKFLKVPPPTPMKKHASGVNSPRKRQLLSSRSTSSRRGAKSVRFTDEGSPPRTRRSSSSLSAADLDLCRTISDSMLETDRKYDKLWNDRLEDK
uniref:Uncharacterized protein n=1 Tax=Caenorhabditis japonica TaxID=281687 RepID=A0A8R1DMP7_CAEJA